MAEPRKSHGARSPSPPQGQHHRSVTIAYPSPGRHDSVPGTSTRVDTHKHRPTNRSIALTSTLLPPTQGLAAKSTLLFDLVDSIYNGHINKESAQAHHQNDDTANDKFQSDYKSMLDKAQGAGSILTVATTSKKPQEIKVINTWRRAPGSAQNPKRKTESDPSRPHSAANLASADGAAIEAIENAIHAAPDESNRLSTPRVSSAVPSPPLSSPHQLRKTSESDRRHSPAASRRQTPLPVKQINVSSGNDGSPNVAVAAAAAALQENSLVDEVLPAPKPESIPPVVRRSEIIAQGIGGLQMRGNTQSMLISNRMALHAHQQSRDNTANSNNAVFSRGTHFHHRTSSAHDREPASKAVRRMVSRNSKSPWAVHGDSLPDVEPEMLDLFCEFYENYKESANYDNEDDDEEEEENDGFLVKVRLKIMFVFT
jgi:hypothetical protein